MTLRFIDPNEVPGIERKPSKVAKFIQEFMASPNPSAAIEGTELSAKVLARLLRSYVHRRSLPIQVVRRGGTVYLIESEEPAEEEEGEEG